MLDALSSQQETDIGDTLNGLLLQFGSAIEFWTTVCLTQRELGDPSLFIERESDGIRDRIQELRSCLNRRDFEPSDAILQQVAKLTRVSAELREVFDSFIQADSIAQNDLEAAVMKLAHVWQDLRMRVWLLGALIPLPTPPALPMEKEAYYQSILDGLFDRFMARRGGGALHERNGKPY